MECNKDEAVRSKTIAERKFSQHDFVGARKFALKARQLFPELEGLPQFISVLDVHIVARDKLLGGETDWYGILQVDPEADENTIRKHYRRLALLLHPDKNKSLGAEAAFKHISEAWGVLSNRGKKEAYDRRCSARSSQSFKTGWTTDGFPNENHASTNSQPQSQAPPPPPPPPPHPQPSPPTTAPVSTPTFIPVPPFVRAPAASDASCSPHSPPLSNVKTFWTQCPFCQMQLEYYRLHVQKYLCCPVCLKPFLAREIVSVGGTLLWPLQDKERFKMDPHVNGLFNGSKQQSPFLQDDMLWPPPFGNASAFPPMNPFEKNEKARKGTDEVQKKKDTESKWKGKNKRDREEIKAKAAAYAKEVIDRLIAKSKGAIEQNLLAEKERKAGLNKAKDARTHSMMSMPLSVSRVKEACEKVPIPFVNVSGPSNGTTAGDSGEGNIGTSLSSRTYGSPKPSQGKMETSTCSHEYVSSVKKAKTDSEGNEKMQGEHAGDNVTRLEGQAGQKKLFLSPKCRPKMAGCKGVGKLLDVPDSDFNDFDKDRKEDQLLPGHVWAAYDDDGMPRYYGRINKVVSLQPFKVTMSWLEPRSPSDETIAWLDSGLSYTCGEFKLGKGVACEHVNMLSHVMRADKSLRGGFLIYPRQGEVWALYGNWDKFGTSNQKPQYAMIEVLTDLRDEVGIKVSLLVKVDGFKTIFRRLQGTESMTWIASKDLRRFSHRAPAYWLMPEQGLGIQECCWELDPAATPTDLITGNLLE